MEYRRKNNVCRHDFLDLLMEIRKHEKIDEISQLFGFFVAGFETSSTTLSNVLYGLAMNKKIQHKLRNEILEELKKNEGNITYDSVNSMRYLDKVLKETLRKYSPVSFIMRKSVSPLEFPNTDMTIPANMKNWLPILGIQCDPHYYPKPEIFDPKRFNEEAIKARPDMTFFPFGDGPRNCIGAHFGTMQFKVGIITILRNYTVEVCDKTDLNYEIDRRTLMLAPKNGIFLTLKKRIP